MSVDLTTSDLRLLARAPGGLKHLKDIILSLAVRGNLVSQDPKDEPSSILLEKIESEKERALKEERTLKPISQEELLFKLPNGWEWARLPQLVTLDKYAIKRGPFGSSIRKDIFVTDGFKVYGQKNAIYNDFTLGSYYINADKYEELSAFRVKPFDIIVSCSGTIGKLAILPSDAEEGIINQALLKLSLNTDIFLNEFFLIVFSGYILKTGTLLNLKGTAIKNIVSVKKLKNIPIPLPPILEQSRIVEKVDNLFEKIDELEKLLSQKRNVSVALSAAALDRLVYSDKKLDQDTNWHFIKDNVDVITSESIEHVKKLRETILSLAVRGKLSPQDSNDEPASELLKKINAEKENQIRQGKIKPPKTLASISQVEIPYEIPENWEWVRLAALGLTKTGSTPSTNHPEYYGDYMPFIKPADISENGVRYRKDGLSIEGMKIARVIQKNSILMVCIGGSIGKVGLVTQECSSNQQINAITPYLEKIDLYLATALRSKLVKLQVLNLASQTTLPIINKGKWDKLILPLPPLEEINRINKIIFNLFSICDDLEEKIRKREGLSEKYAKSLVSNIV